MINHIVTLLIAIVVAILAYLNSQRGEMEVSTFALAKITRWVLPATFPQNNTISAQRWRKLLAIGSLNAEPMPNISHSDVYISSGDSNERKLLRIYNSNSTSVQRQRDVILFLFAGAWVMGSVHENERTLKTMALFTDYVVVGVDYSLAPEHPFPQGFNDAHSALKWVTANIAAYGGNPDRIFISGESAGGNIAAALTAYNLDASYVPLHERAKVIGLLLVYPPMAANFSAESYIKYRNYNGQLTTEKMQHVWALYSGGVQISSTDYRYQPLYAPEALLAQFPPTEIVYAEYDVLRDDSVMFADKLRTLGVTVTTTYYAHTIHGFFGRVLVSTSLGMSSLSDACQKIVSMSSNVPAV